MRESLVLLGGLAGLLGCGAPADADVQATKIARRPPVVRIDYVVNACPTFVSFSIEPPTPDLETPAVLGVVAVDLESEELDYEWSADVGAVRDTQGSTNVYECAEVGPVIVTATATDTDGCSRGLNIYFSCGDS